MRGNRNCLYVVIKKMPAQYSAGQTKNTKMKTFKLLLLSFFISKSLFAQEASVSGLIKIDEEPVPNATISVINMGHSVKADSSGNYYLKHIPAGTQKITVSAVGCIPQTKAIHVLPGKHSILNFSLSKSRETMEDIVITGTLKPVTYLQSPVAVQVYSSAFLKKNPTCNIFDALQMVNGVRPQINCNVCNTGDIHINGLEGPYAMTLIDGMPIVSALGTVYGLSGIPNSLVEKIEIVKGPASSLYGSEAVSGLINIITKNATKAPLISVDAFATSYKEYNIDLGVALKAGKNANVLTGINYFNYQEPVDKNNDNFTDVTLQHRISVFQKWDYKRKENRLLSIAGRYLYEDRWGGDMRWKKKYRGGDSLYGESIYTNRWEMLGSYQLPAKEKLFLNFSLNSHAQNSAYGTTLYLAQQNIAFTQLTWDKKIKQHDLLAGTALRYTYYKDNTPATQSYNPAQNTWLPGIFLQDEINMSKRHTLLLGARYDYNSIHGSIITPRIAYKWMFTENDVLRLNAGTGYRVVNLFTEDHAALTGARTVIIKSTLKPERSYNVNLNFAKKIFTGSGSFIGIDATAFYTYFNNRIVADYETDITKIIYDNLSGYAISKGVSLNLTANLRNGLSVITGATYMENPIMQDGKKQQQILTEKFSGTWAVSYKIPVIKLLVDYTGNVYSPMRLPLLGNLDPRKPYSPWWGIQNIQLTKAFENGIEIYGGLKNLLNWTPAKGNEFIIARSHDPFDKNVHFDANGKPIVTPENPYGLKFDPSYVYASNQGIRAFLGVRYNIIRK